MIGQETGVHFPGARVSCKLAADREEHPIFLDGVIFSIASAIRPLY